eukprot:scaffold8710_cov180-Ochromonas_danica.AAC.1
MVGGLDMESYCPALRSIHIRRWYGYERNPDVDEVKDNLSDFLSHCHSLQGVTIWMKDDDSYVNIVLALLLEKLRENSLIKIALLDNLKLNESQVMLDTLMRKHASSLRDLHVNEIGVDLLFSSLIKNDIHLRVLDVCIVGDLSQSAASLISYLSSAGDLLESLKVWFGRGPYNIVDLLVSLASSCPNLIRLDFYGAIPCSMEIVRFLYEQCPHLLDVNIYGTIDTNSKLKAVSIYVKDSNDDWAVCLFHVLRRRQYKQVTLRLTEDYYRHVENLKSLLEPYEIRLETSAPESTLISLLQDLPHLNSLCMTILFDYQYTDATLTAFKQHVAKSLTELQVASGYLDVNSFSCIDRFVSELIETCQLLERLTMPCYGLESLVAVSKHSSLRFVNLAMTVSVTEEMLDGLLLDDKVTWPSSLVTASVRSYRWCYTFNKKKSRHWSKRRV